MAGIRFLSNFNANEFIVTNNIVSQNGTGIHSVENATASSNYNDVWGNSVDLQGLASSTADISLDPLFIDAPNGDFHLQPNSPAIDAGNPTRPKDSDNTIADMGAFPYLQKPATPILISPADSSEGVSSNATLSWNSAERASNYDIQLARTDSFKVMVLEQYALSGTMFTVSGLKANETYFWRVRATNIAGDSDWSDVWKFKVGTPTAVRMGNDIPAEFSLNQNYPSPFNPSTTIEFSLPRSSHVILKIFNIRGEEIETLVDNDLSPGTYNVAWNGEKMGSGTYFYRIRAGEFTGSRRMTVIR